jgi:hypothetical protein
MKKIIGGLLMGCILSFSIAYAEDIIKVQKASFPILVNGSLFKTNKPILAVDNSVYVPVRDFSDCFKANVTWDSEVKRVEITNVPFFDEDSVLTDNFKIQMTGECGGGNKQDKFSAHFSFRFENIGSTPINIDFSKDFKLRDRQDQIVSCLSNEKQTIEPGQTKLIKLNFEINSEDVEGYINFIYKPSIREYSIPISFEPLGID